MARRTRRTPPGRAWHVPAPPCRRDACHAVGRRPRHRRWTPEETRPDPPGPPYTSTTADRQAAAAGWSCWSRPGAGLLRRRSRRLAGAGLLRRRSGRLGAGLLRRRSGLAGAGLLRRRSGRLGGELHLPLVLADESERF